MHLRTMVHGKLRELLSDGGKICIGLSGGVDSIVLLDLVQGFTTDAKRRLSAVHVHHALSPNADAWADFCREICASRGIALRVERVRVDRAAPEGLEAAARAARYAVYAAQDAGFVALAHHRDDQSETLLLQLLRGTGLKGAAAMPEVRPLAASRVQLVRPMLEVSRAEILAHAKAAGLRWIEDESNASLRHDRNFVRHEIAPQLDARFPHWRDAAARFARHAAGAGALLDSLAVVDGLPAAAGLDLPVRPGLADDRRANLLRAFLALNAIAMPSETRLAEMTRQLFGARDDARLRLDHAGVTLVRYRSRVRIAHLAAGGSPWQRAWTGELEIELGAGLGRVRFERVEGTGLEAARSAQPGWHFAGRAGGERFRPDARRPTRTLKNLLQEHAVPPWERERMPLLFHGEHLVWAPGIGVDAEYACPPGRPGLRPTWLPAG